MEGDLVEVIAQLSRWLESKASLALGVYSPGIHLVLIGALASRLDERTFLFTTLNADIRVPNRTRFLRHRSVENERRAYQRRSERTTISARFRQRSDHPRKMDGS